MQKKKYNTGVCLGGGGALGFAHIGALEALEQKGIYPEAISGSSMGCIIGAFYAYGYSPEEIKNILEEEKLSKTFRLLNFRFFSKTGLSSHKTLFQLLEKYIPRNNFNTLKKKLFICVVNLNKGKWEIKDSGDKLYEYIIASSAVPLIYEAAVIDGYTYVDGGVLNNLPVEPLKETCSHVTAIDVVPYFEHNNFEDRLSIASSYIYLQNHLNSKLRYKYCDDLIFINSIEKYHAFNFNAYKDIIKAGYYCTLQYLESNKGT
jgi:NTE family protein